MKRNVKNKSVDVVIRVISADNKLLGSCKGVMKGIGDAGKLSAVLAAESAAFVRAADKAAAPAGKKAVKAADAAGKVKKPVAK